MAYQKNFKMSISERRARKFTDSFKIKKVREIERGKASISEIVKAYEVSPSNVYKWLSTFGIMAKKVDKIVVQTESDTQEIISLRKKVADLERLVGQKQILLEFKDKMIEIAEEVYGVDINKKYGTSPSNTSEETKIK
ncbi:MAG: transposase [Saprospiraceae bacterium]|nr:transposase [Saprospiraceae bacterium]